MICFYDLSRLTQKPLWPEEFDDWSLASSRSNAGRIKAVGIKTSGAFEVAVLAPRDTKRLSRWLAKHHFSLPNETRSRLDRYITNHRYFVAAKTDPDQSGFVLESGSPRTSPPTPPAGHEMVSTELAPLSISFPSEKCVAPLIVSTASPEPSRAAIFALSREPLLSRVIFGELGAHETA